MKANIYNRVLGVVLSAVFSAVSLCAAEPVAEPKWVGLGVRLINLDEVIKIEIAGTSVTFISPSRKVVFHDPDLRKEAMNRLRSLMRTSPNWVEISNSREENQEWYANLSRVANIISFKGGGNVSAAGLFWEGKKLGEPGCFVGVVSSNDAATKLLRYVAQNGFSLDRDDQ